MDAAAIGTGRADAGGGAGANYLVGTSKKVPSPYYSGKTMDMRTGDTTGNTARLYSDDIMGGYVPIHENLHLMGLGDRYSDNVQYNITLTDKNGTSTSTIKLNGVAHEGYEGDAMANGWGFSQTNVDNLANKALGVSGEKGSDNFYMGRKGDNANNNDASAVPQTKKESGITWQKTYSTPTIVK